MNFLELEDYLMPRFSTWGSEESVRVISVLGIFLCASAGGREMKSKWLRQVGGRGREFACSNNWEFQKWNWAQGSSLPSQLALPLGWVYQQAVSSRWETGWLPCLRTPEEMSTPLSGWPGSNAVISHWWDYSSFLMGVRVRGYELEWLN